jgi:hypothetical protein
MEAIYAISFASIPTLIFHVVKVIRKKRKEATISALKAKVWKVFSLYVRSKDRDFQDCITCFTCDRRDHFRTFDAGHFIPKSTGGAALYFYERNVHPQCTGCNRFRHGNLSVYALRLQQRYGPTILEELHALRGQQWNKKELERLLAHYTLKLKNLDAPHYQRSQPVIESASQHA